MIYDNMNRLLSVAWCNTPSIPFLTLTYDPEGRLAAYTYNLVTTQFAYDGVNLIAKYQNGTMTQRYVHGTGTDNPLIWYTGPGVGSGGTFFVTNYQGSVIGTTNASGTRIELYKYDPYGVPKNFYNNNYWGGARFRYTGQYAIPEAKLYYYKARVYDPNYGRFLQTDPIGSKDDLDLYAYVKGDPVNATDPTGQECNKERTSCWADNAQNSRAPDVRHNADTDSAVVANTRKFQNPTRSGGEPTGTVTGTTVTTTESIAGSTTTGDTAAFSVKDVDAGVHGHLGDSVVDDPASNRGYGDTQSIEKGKPMYTVEGSRVGVHDAPGGVLRFEMVKGRMTPDEAKSIQKNLNDEQKLFNQDGN